MTTIIAITPSGRHINAATNTAAINRPTASATGRSRLDGCGGRARAGDRTAGRLAAAASPRLRWRTSGHSGRIGADRDPRMARTGGSTPSCSLVTASCSSGCVERPGTTSAGLVSVGESSLQTGDSDGERRPHVEIVASPTGAAASRTRGRDAASHRWAVRSSAGATRCRWRRTTADRRPPTRSRVGVRARPTADRIVLLIVTIPPPGVVRHRLSFPSPLLGHARTPRVRQRAQTSSSSCSLRPNALSM